MSGSRALIMMSLGAVLLAGAGCSAKSDAPAATAQRGSEKTADAVDQAPMASRWLTATAPIDDPAVRGIPLDEALRRVGKPVPLPQLGGDAVKKVVLRQGDPGRGEAPEFFTLTIRYSSGTLLYVHPGRQDLDGLMKDEVASSEAKYTDGSDGTDHYRREIVAGKDVVTRIGGVRSGRANGLRVETAAFWNEAGYTYSLFSPAEDAAALTGLRSMVSATR